MLETAAIWRRLTEGEDDWVTETPADGSSIAQDESAPENGSVAKAVETESSSFS
jgi:hypothetical protein